MRTPQWTLIYNGINISTDVSTMVLSVSYSDVLSELSGEVEIIVEDHDQVWQSSWYPALGDEINLTIGYQGEALLLLRRLSDRSVGAHGPAGHLYDAMPRDFHHSGYAHAEQRRL